MVATQNNQTRKYMTTNHTACTPFGTMSIGPVRSGEPSTKLAYHNNLLFICVKSHGNLSSLIHVLDKDAGKRIILLRVRHQNRRDHICSLQILWSAPNNCELFIGMNSGTLYHYAFDVVKMRSQSKRPTGNDTDSSVSRSTDAMTKKQTAVPQQLDLSVELFDEIDEMDDIVLDDEDDTDERARSSDHRSTDGSDSHGERDNKRVKSSNMSGGGDDLQCMIELNNNGVSEDATIISLDESSVVCNFGTCVQDMRLYVSKSKKKGRRIVSVCAFDHHRSRILEIVDIKKALKSRLKKKIKFQTTCIRYPTSTTGAVNDDGTTTTVIETVFIFYPRCLMDEQSKMKMHIGSGSTMQYIDDALFAYLFGPTALLIQAPVCVLGTSSGSIYYHELNRDVSDAQLLIHWKDTLQSMSVSSMDPTQNSNQSQQQMNMVSLVGKNGHVYCIYSLGGSGGSSGASNSRTFVSKQFHTKCTVVGSTTVKNYLIVLDRHGIVNSYALSESDPNPQSNSWLPPSSIQSRELIQSKNTVALCNMDHTRLLSLNKLGRIYGHSCYTRDMIDRALGSALGVSDIQQGIRRLYPMIEAAHHTLDVARTRIQSVNNDIESLNNAMHVIALVKCGAKLPVTIIPRHANFHCARNTRQLDISLKNQSGFNLTKHWSVFIVLSDSTKYDITSHQTENYCFPIGDLMLGGEWTQCIERTLSSYSPTHISVYICFKMPEHEQGFSLLIHRTALDCWDFVVPMPESTSLLDETDSVLTIENQLYQILQPYAACVGHSSSSNSGTTTTTATTTHTRTIQTLKFSIAGRHERDLSRLKLSVGTSQKFMTHMGELVSIQVRRPPSAVTTIQKQQHHSNPNQFEVTLHSCSHLALLAIKQAILCKILSINIATTATTTTTTTLTNDNLTNKTFTSNTIAGTSSSTSTPISQDALESLISYQNSLLELRDKVDHEVRHSMNHDRLIHTTLRQMNTLYDELLGTYSKMR